MMCSLFVLDVMVLIAKQPRHARLGIGANDQMFLPFNIEIIALVRT